MVFLCENFRCCASKCIAKKNASKRATIFVAERFACLGQWTLILIGEVNLWGRRRPAKAAQQLKLTRPIIAQPFLLGILLAAGFETASQLSALIIAGQNNPWLLGLAFSAGMILVDGIDGSLAAGTQRFAAIGQSNALRASKMLGVIIVIFPFGLSGAELAGMELDSFIFPLGIGLFAVVIGIRIWAGSNVSTMIDAKAFNSEKIVRVTKKGVRKCRTSFSI